jgi:hypothetical protein
MTRTKKRRKRAEGKHRLPSAGTFSNGREFGEPADWWSFIHQGTDHLAELSIGHVLYPPGYRRTRRGHMTSALRESAPSEVTWNLRSGVRIRGPHSSSGLEGSEAKS